ncbi:leucine-rich repeat-containing protein 34-like [Coccinella septempunctata]|uniref:leucine-rich repeat-containing protein 34-like n=1 Tax=Coccinella septempunctata TaxID=41139 RepID=UPI001D087EEF|nr:leucine-rich repeat-containing protein 34-like [Coccinella septempunctata]
MNSSEVVLLPNSGFKFTETFFLLFCEKNSDGTRHLRLKGKELYQRIGKRLSHMDMLVVSLFLREHLEIISVDLCYNDIGDVGVEILVENYFDDKNNTLLDLNLMSNDLTSAGLSHLYKSAKNLKLRTLRLTGNKFGKKGGEYVAKLIESIPSLELLELGDTDQVLTSIDSILETTKKSNLKVLDISRVIPKTEYEILNPSWMAKNVGLFLEINRTLTELHMEKCGLDGHDIEKLMHGMIYNTSLKLLNIASNRIGCHGLKVLAEWLAEKPPLHGLDVSYNRISDSGARALSFGMCYSRLKFLNISYNRIGDDGIACILDTLKKPYQMRLFFFYGNPFGSKSLKIVKRMIMSGVLLQKYIDTKLYEVDGELNAAFYPTNHFKQQYYSVMMHGFPEMLKIKRNKVEPPNHKRRPFYHLPYYERYQPFDN